MDAVGRAPWEQVLGACFAKLGCVFCANVTTLSNECHLPRLEEQKGTLSLPSLNGKTDHDEKDISTLRSEAPQQARLPQAHVYSQRPQRFELASSQGTQEIVCELRAPSQRHRALSNDFTSHCAVKGIPFGVPFFHTVQTISSSPSTKVHAPSQGAPRTSPWSSPCRSSWASVRS